MCLFFLTRQTRAYRTCRPACCICSANSTELWKGRQQVVTQGRADVTVMQMFLHQWPVLQTLPDQSNDHLNKDLTLITKGSI